jgi:phenylalanyl-tRNA synthetase beta chain
MRISYNWLKDYVALTESPEALAHRLTMLGLEVEEITHFGRTPADLQGVVVGRVVAKEKHPNADRLSVCSVNVGQPEPLTIVCGASNVAAGQNVAVALPGATLKPFEGEPINIKRSKIRGVESSGMICAEDELGIGASHEGIMVLAPEAQVGSALSDVLPLEQDVVFTIGLTPNRTDAMSHWGVARDLAASLNIEIKPIDSSIEFNSLVKPISILTENAARVGRYAGCVISGLRVCESPGWLQSRLTRIGLRPINNVVDITNYVLHSLGQPLHAFDLARIPGKQIRVKLAQQGQTLTTLDGKTRELNPDDLVIAGEGGEPLCLAGVMGGLESGTTETTSAIFLESAWFEASGVRRVARRHGIHSDSSFRFERGTDPNTVVLALEYAAHLIQCIAGGEVSEIIDIQNADISYLKVQFNANQANQLMGLSLTSQELEDYMRRLGMNVEWNQGATTAQVEVPRYRTDVTRTADIAEDILRIYGFDNVDIPNKLVATPDIEDDSAHFLLQQLVSDKLAGLGLMEIVTNSLLDKQYESDIAVTMLNPVSQEHTVLRTSMLHSGLQVLGHNHRRQLVNCRFFDFGKVYQLAGDGYSETKQLALYLTGDDWEPNWLYPSKPSQLFHIRAWVQAVVGWLLPQVSISFQPFWEGDNELRYGLTVSAFGQKVGKLGCVHTAHTKDYEIKGNTYYASLDWARLAQLSQSQVVEYTAVAKFPGVVRDISLLLAPGESWGRVDALLAPFRRGVLVDYAVFDVFDLGHGNKALGVKFTFQADDRTLEDKDIDKAFKPVLAAIESAPFVSLRV